MKQDLPVTYDAMGRMNWHPDFHVPRKTPWTTSDEQYLIENYATLGPKEVGMVLGRTENTVTNRVCELRKAGRMPKPAKRTYTRRSR